MGEQLVIKEHIGTNPIPAEKYLLDNQEHILQKELSFRKKFLEATDLAHNPSLSLRVEKQAIRIHNLVEAKNVSEELKIEFIKQFIFNSNNIEGSRIPPERVQEIIDTGNTTYNNRSEVQEVHNSQRAYEYLLDTFRFNTASIKRLYHILTQDLGYPKGFKKEPIIAGNEQTTPPEHVEKELDALLEWYKANKKKLHPLTLAFTFHLRYEAIHPFTDGNGRTGRLLMNKILMSANYPPIIVYKENKQAYFNSISQARDGNKKKYTQFMLTQADKSYAWQLEVLKKY